MEGDQHPCKRATLQEQWLNIFIFSFFSLFLVSCFFVFCFMFYVLSLISYFSFYSSFISRYHIILFFDLLSRTDKAIAEERGILYEADQEVPM